ncbi:hypothetical protein DM860_006854 [Cuscuta australis]|uniref:Uncharacterized protein n=1 Tax=Cuscuta australis TaxID=267555 RepID=A0A328E5C0_9ASTE|nr:hypothetical protein DM860_006854 [Cuscuta australis]
MGGKVLLAPVEPCDETCFLVEYVKGPKSTRVVATNPDSGHEVARLEVRWGWPCGHSDDDCSRHGDDNSIATGRQCSGGRDNMVVEDEKE